MSGLALGHRNPTDWLEKRSRLIPSLRSISSHFSLLRLLSSIYRRTKKFNRACHLLNAGPVPGSKEVIFFRSKTWLCVLFVDSKVTYIEGLLLLESTESNTSLTFGLLQSRWSGIDLRLRPWPPWTSVNKHCRKRVKTR